MYQLTERIFSASSADGRVFLKEQLQAFFQEVVDRRVSNEEGGLQASILVLPEKVGAKVCEGNGLSSHHHSHINLLRFLNGRKEFLTPYEMSKISLYREDQEEMIRTAVEGRILSNTEEMGLVLFSNKDTLTDFQKEVIEVLVELCQEIQNQNIYQSVKLGISTEEFSREFDELTDDTISDIQENFQESKKQK